MPKSKIEWCDYTINPVKGLCPVACPYCYARAMYHRFKWDSEIRFEPSVFNDLPKMKAGSRIFWGSTMELFGDWVDPEWMRLILERVKAHPELTHFFLTKQPQNLIKFSPFPDNCWVGVTVTKPEFLFPALDALDSIQCSVRYLSIEPMLAPFDVPDLSLLLEGSVDWLILGSQTKPYKPPEIEWVEEMVEACDKAGVKVFLKNNLMPLIIDQPRVPSWSSNRIGLRQEMPRCQHE